MPGFRRLFVFALICVAVIGAYRFQIDVEILNVLPSNDRVAQGIAEYQKNFLNGGELLVVLRADDPQVNLEAAKAVFNSASEATSLVQSVYWQPPSNDSITGSAQFLAYLWMNGGTQAVQVLRENIRPENLPRTLAESKELIATSFSPADMFILPRDPLGLHRAAANAGETMETPDRFFASEDGRMRIVYVYAAVPLNDYEECREWVAGVRRLVRGAIESGGPSTKASFSLTGRPVFVDEISSGMKGDMSTAVPGTLLAIAILFYLLHREIKSLLMLLGTLSLVLVWAALAGAALLGEVNVVSIGFASILLGLAEDFGIVLHQELKLHPRASAEYIRSIAGKGIVGSAVTTASAFALLNLSSLPGLRALGTFVAFGIVIGAWAMLFIFLPMIARFARPNAGADESCIASGSAISSRVGVALTSLFLLFSLAVIAFKAPAFDPSPDVLRPRVSEASDTVKAVQEMIGAGDPYWLLVRGDSIEKVGAQLAALQNHLAANQKALGIEAFSLPVKIWPDRAAQRSNATALQQVAADGARIKAEVLAQGFTTDALPLMEAAFEEWRAADLRFEIWPRGRVAEWVLPKFVARKGTNYMALGLITPGRNLKAEEVIPSDLKADVLLSGWGLLGQTVLQKVRREVPLISAAVAATVICALWLTFRSAQGVLASLGTMAFSAVLLLAIMVLAGWKWNLINLTALPLLLGMGIDYSIHILGGLERFQNDARATFAAVGKALLLAGSTSIAGFFFLSFSSNSGMASLGKVCALGLTLLLLTSVFLLPAWMNYLSKRPRVAQDLTG